jgi:hypothetical protein
MEALNVKPGEKANEKDVAFIVGLHLSYRSSPLVTVVKLVSPFYSRENAHPRLRLHLPLK